jgi:hypothetical protein
MDRQPVINVRAPAGPVSSESVSSESVSSESVSSRSGALLVEDRPPDILLEVVAPRTTSTATLRLWAWRAVLAMAVVLALAGMLAWSSTPPA